MKYQKLEAVGRSTFFSDKDFLIKKKKSVHCERFSSIYPGYNNMFNSIGGVMSSVLTLSAVDHGSDWVN